MTLEYSAAPLVIEAYAIVSASGTAQPGNANSGVIPTQISTGLFQLALPIDMKQPSGSNLIFITPRVDRADNTTFVIMSQISDQVIQVSFGRHTGADVINLNTEFEFALFRSF